MGGIEELIYCDNLRPDFLMVETVIVKFDVYYFLSIRIANV